MGGSIRIPSSCCGVFGLRPSPFQVPTEAPDGTRLSVRGPLARSVSDLRIAYELMSGRIAPEPGQRPLSVIAPTEGTIGADPACAAAQERAIQALSHAGHHVVCRGRWDPAPVARAYQVVRPVTMGVTPGEPDEYGPAVKDAIAEGRRTSGQGFLRALEEGIGAASFVHNLLHGHDILLTPTLGRVPMPIADVPPFLHEEWIGYTQYVLPVSFAGLPAVSVPAGLHDGLPVGVQLVAPFGLEWQLLDIAAQLAREPGFGFQRPPGFD
jgi:amidase